MHKFKRRSTKNVIGLKLWGRLESKEYQKIVPYLEERIREFGKIRLLIEFDHWEGWGRYAPFKDLIFVLKNSFKIDRVAFVVNSKADKQVILIDQPFTPWFGHNTRYFSSKEKAEAWRWVEEGFILDEPKEEQAAVAADKDVSSEKKKIRYGADMRILVVGGGVSGLTVAALLEQRGFEPLIAEAAKEHPKNYGVLNLLPTSYGVLKALGLFKKFQKSAEPVTFSTIYNPEGDILKKYDQNKAFGDYGSCMSIPYGKLGKLLRKNLNANALRMGLAVTKLKDMRDGVKATFSDGSKDTFDCVVCCDGIHSKMRELVFDVTPPIYSGMVGWSFCIEPDFEYPQETLEYGKEDRHMRCFPSGKQLYIFAAVKHGESDLTAKGNCLDLLKKVFKHFKGLVPKILGAIDDETPIIHKPIYILERDEWVHGRVALLGSSAFSFLPTTILGGSLGLEAAYVFVDELARSDSRYVPRALEAYEVRRHRRIKEIKERLKKYKLEHHTHGLVLLMVKDYPKHLIDNDTFCYFWEEILGGSI